MADWADQELGSTQPSYEEYPTPVSGTAGASVGAPISDWAAYEFGAGGGGSSGFGTDKSYLESTGEPLERPLTPEWYTHGKYAPWDPYDVLGQHGLGEKGYIPPPTPSGIGTGTQVPEFTPPTATSGETLPTPTPTPVQNEIPPTPATGSKFPGEGWPVHGTPAQGNPPGVAGQFPGPGEFPKQGGGQPPQTTGTLPGKGSAAHGGLGGTNAPAPKDWADYEFGGTAGASAGAEAGAGVGEGVSPPSAPPPEGNMVETPGVFRLLSSFVSGRPGVDELPISIPINTPILGGLFHALNAAWNTTTPEHISGAVRDIPVVGGVTRVVETVANLLQEAGEPVSGALVMTAGIAQTGASQALGMKVPSVDDFINQEREVARKSIEKGDIVGALNDLYRGASTEQQLVYSLINPAYWIQPSFGIGEKLATARAALFTKPVEVLSMFERMLAGLPKVEGGVLKGTEQIFGKPSQGWFDIPGLLRKQAPALEHGILDDVVGMARGKWAQVADIDGTAVQKLQNIAELTNAWIKGIGDIEHTLPINDAALRSRVGQQGTALMSGWSKEARNVVKAGRLAMKLIEEIGSAATNGGHLPPRSLETVLQEIASHAAAYENKFAKSSVWWEIASGFNKGLEALSKRGLDAATFASERAKLLNEAQHQALFASMAKLENSLVDNAGRVLEGTFAQTKFIPGKGEQAIAGARFMSTRTDPLTRFSNFMGSVKSWQSAVVLGLNPYYAMRNIWNNVSTMQAYGNLGLWTPTRSMEYVRNLLGYTPVRLSEGLGAGGVTSKMPFTRFASWSEGIFSSNAYATGLRRTINQLIPHGKGWVFNPETINAFNAADPSGMLLRKTTSLMENGFKSGKSNEQVLKEIRSLLDGKGAPASVDWAALKNELVKINPKYAQWDETLLRTYADDLEPILKHMEWRLKGVDDTAALGRLEKHVQEQIAAARQGMGYPAAKEITGLDELNKLVEQLGGTKIPKGINPKEVADQLARMGRIDLPAMPPPVSRYEQFSQVANGKNDFASEAAYKLGFSGKGRYIENAWAKHISKEVPMPRTTNDFAKFADEHADLMDKWTAYLQAKAAEKGIALRSVDQFIAEAPQRHAANIRAAEEALRPPMEAARGQMAQEIPNIQKIAAPERVWTKMTADQRMRVLMNSGMSGAETQEFVLRGGQWMDIPPDVRYRALDYVKSSNLSTARAMPEQTFADVERKLTALKKAEAPEEEIAKLRDTYRQVSRAGGISAEAPQMSSEESIWRVQDKLDSMKATGVMPPLVDGVGEAQKMGQYYRDFAQALANVTDYGRVGKAAHAEELARTLENDLMHNILPAVNDIKTTAAMVSEWYRDAALINYKSRRGWNAWVDMFFPYEFWFERTGANWMRYFADNPSKMAMYVHLKETMDQLQDDPKFPQRFKGLVQIPLPGVPQWLGGSGFIDPLNTLYPLDQLTRSFTYLPFTRANNHDIAVALRKMAANSEITGQEAEMAIRSKSGSLWDMASKQVHALDQNPYDVAGLTLSPYAPMDWLWKMATNRPEEIRGLLPIAGLVKGATAVMREAGIAKDIIPAGGFNPDPTAFFKQKLFNAPYDQYDNYRVDRALADLVATGQITERDAKRALIERTGTVFDRALQFAAMEGFIPDLTGVTGFRAKVFPQGERNIYEQNLQLKQYIDLLVKQAGGDPTALSYDGKKELLQKKDLWGNIGKFYEAHPELSVNIEKSQEPEKRLRDWYVEEFWTQYNAMSELDKKKFRMEHPDVATAIISKESRNYDALTNTKLAEAVYLLKGYLPKVAPNTVVNALPDLAQLGLPQYVEQNPEMAAAYKAWLTRYTEIKDKEDAYYKLAERSADRRAYLAANPDLKAYFDWNTAFWKEHPELAKLIGHGTLQSTYNPLEGQFIQGYKEVAPKGGAPTGYGRAGGGGGGTAYRTTTYRPPAQKFNLTMIGDVLPYLNAYWTNNVELTQDVVSKLMGYYSKYADRSKYPSLTAWLNYLKRLSGIQTPTTQGFATPVARPRRPARMGGVPSFRTHRTGVVAI